MQLSRCSCGCSAVSDSSQPHGLQPARLHCPWDPPDKKYWREVPFPPPGDLPNPGFKPASPALARRFLPLSRMRSPTQEITHTSTRSYCVRQTGVLRSAEVRLGKCERDGRRVPDSASFLLPRPWSCFQCWSCFYWCLPGLFAPICLPARHPSGPQPSSSSFSPTPPSISHPEKTRPTSQLSQRWNRYFKRAQ